jgi:hypothetical protein
MTILIHFHQSHYRTFKAYYTEHVERSFPVPRFGQMTLPMLAYLQSRYGACTGISFIDDVCDPKRVSQHRVFAVDAKRGKTSMGWFFGFKLHVAANDQWPVV